MLLLRLQAKGLQPNLLLQWSSRSIPLPEMLTTCLAASSLRELLSRPRTKWCSRLVAEDHVSACLVQNMELIIGRYSLNGQTQYILTTHEGDAFEFDKGLYRWAVGTCHLHEFGGDRTLRIHRNRPQSVPKAKYCVQLPHPTVRNRRIAPPSPAFSQ